MQDLSTDMVSGIHLSLMLVEVMNSQHHYFRELPTGGRMKGMSWYGKERISHFSKRVSNILLTWSFSHNDYCERPFKL